MAGNPSPAPPPPPAPLWLRLVLYIGLCGLLLWAPRGFGFLSVPEGLGQEIGQPARFDGPAVRLRIVGRQSALYVVADVVSRRPVGMRRGTVIFATDVSSADGIVHLRPDTLLHREARFCQPGCVLVESSSYPVTEPQLRTLARARTAELVVVGEHRSFVARVGHEHLAFVRLFVGRYLTPSESRRTR